MDTPIYNPNRIGQTFQPFIHAIICVQDTIICLHPLFVILCPLTFFRSHKRVYFTIYHQCNRYKRWWISRYFAVPLHHHNLFFSILCSLSLPSKCTNSSGILSFSVFADYTLRCSFIQIPIP
eukprot:701395_1